MPCGYLKRWAASDSRVWVYRGLVSHDNVDVWRPVSLRGVAKHAHLYTQLLAGTETDAVERWLDSEFETPAQGALDKATTDARMTPDDWTRLIKFAAAQAVRTPAWLQRRYSKWQEEMPAFIQETLQRTVERLEHPDQQRVAQAPAVPEVDLEGAPFVITRRDGPDSENVEIGIEVLLGRQMWVWEIKRAFTSTWRVLREHKWTILKPPVGTTWPTSDNPVVQLNFRSRGDYDFGGGWGSKGSEILLPLDSEHLLYARIGYKADLRNTRVSSEIADIMREVIVNNAYRIVFADQPDSGIPLIRPRVVSAEQYRQEQDMWREWPEQQLAAEAELYRRTAEARRGWV